MFKNLTDENNRAKTTRFNHTKKELFKPLIFDQVFKQPPFLLLRAACALIRASALVLCYLGKVVKFLLCQVLDLFVRGQVILLIPDH